MTRARKANFTPSTSAPPRDAKPGDNAKAIEEAEAAQLLSYLAKAREKKGVKDKCAAALKAASDELNEVFRLAKGASPNFTRQRMVELMTDMSSPQLRKSIEADEAIRARFRRVCGLPVADEGRQTDLEDRMPEAAKDQMHYRGLGYTAGLAGENGTPPAFIPTNFNPDWGAGWKDGQAALISAKIKASEIPPPAPKRDPKPEPEKSLADERLEEQRQINAAKASLAAIPSTKGEFDEASAEELAAQAGRVDSEADAIERDRQAAEEPEEQV